MIWAWALYLVGSAVMLFVLIVRMRHDQDLLAYEACGIGALFWPITIVILSAIAYGRRLDRLKALRR